jgi:hypothetical protein
LPKGVERPRVVARLDDAGAPFVAVDLEWNVVFERPSEGHCMSWKAKEPTAKTAASAWSAWGTPTARIASLIVDFARGTRPKLLWKALCAGDC